MTLSKIGFQIESFLTRSSESAPVKRYELALRFLVSGFWFLVQYKRTPRLLNLPARSDFLSIYHYTKRAILHLVLKKVLKYLKKCQKMCYKLTDPLGL